MPIAEMITMGRHKHADSTDITRDKMILKLLTLLSYKKIRIEIHQGYSSKSMALFQRTNFPENNSCI
jgi:hypothetical protein